MSRRTFSNMKLVEKYICGVSTCMEAALFILEFLLSQIQFMHLKEKRISLSLLIGAEGARLLREKRVKGDTPQEQSDE
ncbi:hypothetical protein [Metabacillus sp. RGM 3146]|uniref:hypothetical protein n=1 Tax=Metabacillus sp. RGM 3146 TaxID=3401092 RepID=UPI003B9A5EE0